MKVTSERKPKIWRRLDMPIGDVITIAARYTDGEPLTSNVYDHNHNLYRLNAQGEVLWQVQRNDGGRWDGIWQRHKAGQRIGSLNEHFVDLTLLYPDGSKNIDPVTLMPPDEALWVPKCVVKTRTWEGLIFVLDVDTGIATDITPYPVRPW